MLNIRDRLRRARNDVDHPETIKELLAQDTREELGSAFVPVLLDNPVRNYAWGSRTAIPEFLGHAPAREPQAELWIGAHPLGPSRVEPGGVALTDYIAADPQSTLGEQAVRRFGPHLPFMLKVLAIESPLSIQVHPTRAQAAEGFAAENAAEIPRDAPHRSYKDSCGKHEMLVALTECEALIGFEEPTRVADVFQTCRDRELSHAAVLLRQKSGLEQVVRRWLTLDEKTAERCVASVVKEAHTREGELFSRVVAIHDKFPGDRGVLLAMLMRRVRLKPGQAVFVPSGMVHSYMSGMAVEAQVSSDNTLRAGLTSKHVDPDGVLRILSITSERANIIDPDEGEAPSEYMYSAPAAEFQLSRVRVSQSPTAIDGPRLVLMTTGSATVTTRDATVAVKQGQAVFVAVSDEEPRLTGDGAAYTVTLGSEA